MGYIIVGADGGDWHLDASWLVARLQERWQGAVVRPTLDPESGYSHSWEVPFEQGVVDGRVHRDGDSVALDGLVRPCAEFARWLVSVQPDGRVLEFADDGYRDHIPVSSTTTLTDIMTVFEAYT